MPNFRPVANLDIFHVMPRLVKAEPAKWKPLAARGETGDPEIGLGASMVLRGHSPITTKNWLEDLPVNDTHELAGWASMKRLLARAQRAIMAEATARQYLSGVMGRAMLSRLDPGSTIFWHDDNGPYHEKNVRFHVPLITNPGCLMYSGPDLPVHMEAGTLWFFNNRVRHSAANWGPHMRVHLIFEMRRLDTEVEADV